MYLPHWPIPSTLGKCQIDYETVFERMEIVLKKLKNPHQKLPPIIHIAGTNGKGSVSALLARIFSLAGYKTHLYTSPHLHDCNERILLNGEKISDNFLFEVMEESRIAAERTPLTFMEGFTIGAILAFSKTPADLVIVECGMGARIDATNIIENKLATIITSISFDHTEYLGNSIERIALEKAMIMRPQVPLIVSAQPEEAKRIIKILANDQKVESYFYDEDFFVEMDEKTKEFDFYFKKEKLENLPKPILPGSHQYVNFATAIAAIKSIKNFPVSNEAVKQGISTVKWPSRLEKIENGLNKLLKNQASEIWIDGAHNSGGAFALANWLREFKDNKKNFVIVGFSRNKCKANFLEKFKNIAEIIAVRVDGEPYPESFEVICEIAKKSKITAKGFADLHEAICSIDEEPCRIVICGSLHLARDVKKFSSYL